MASLHVALVHFPTVDKRGNVVATSVTNLDLHDISRASRTYGVEGYWVVHPYQSMHRYVEKVLHFWKKGFGSSYNPSRMESMEFTHLAYDLGEVAEKMEASANGRKIVWVATSAKRVANTIKYAEMRSWLEDEKDDRIFCLLFGTGWGLHPCVMEEMDYILEPINGPTDWNHLSVRAAAGIILDRLRGS
ncbi:MAG: RNA methyltransferase [Sumerlaeia bacterium]